MQGEMIQEANNVPLPVLVSTHRVNDSGEERMLSRIKKQEEDMQVVRMDVAVIKANYATKTDVSEAKQSIIFWVVSAIFLVQLLPTFINHLM
ncbi:hypothetical protein [Kalamiella sp. sgz302252]|uniref:hypothetical protein n=1 Tax=Pantoea sp. sgz302252 TaxID=3341827 RepID=UPI0036D2CDA6